VQQQIAKPPHAARIALFQAISGINPTTDIRTITITGVGPGHAGDDPSAVALVRGAFDAQKLTTIAQATDQHAEERLGSRTLHTWVDKGKPVAGCLAAADLLVLGNDPQRVRSVLRLLDDPKAPAASLPLPGEWKDAAISLCFAHDLDRISGGKLASSALRHVEAIALRADEQGPDMAVDARLTTTDDAAAQDIVDSARGLIAMASMQFKDMFAEATAKPLAEALRATTITRDGRIVAISGRIPQDAALHLISVAPNAAQP
jgi:hypothetical protein